mgnify:CR=1 FL=1
MPTDWTKGSNVNNLGVYCCKTDYKNQTVFSALLHILSSCIHTYISELNKKRNIFTISGCDTCNYESVQLVTNHDLGQQSLIGMPRLGGERLNIHTFFQAPGSSDSGPSALCPRLSPPGKSSMSDTDRSALSLGMQATYLLRCSMPEGLGWFLGEFSVH